MKSALSSAILALGMTVSVCPASQAGPATDAFATCITDSTTGRDRKDLVKWVFVVLGAHPEIKSLAALTDVSRDQADRGAAALFERLVTVNCRDQAKAAIQADGNSSFGAAFQRLGVIASTELMTDTEVQAAMQRFVRHIDNKRVEAALK